MALCPDHAKQDPVVHGADFGVVLLANGPRTKYCIHTVGPRGIRIRLRPEIRLLLSSSH